MKRTPFRPAATFLLSASLAWPAAAQQSGPPAVGVVTVKQQSITETDEFVGRVQAIDRVDLVARVTGFLEKRLFTEGAEVKPGDLLYQIEKPPFEADVEAKTASVAQANAQLQNASITLGRANAGSVRNFVFGVQLGRKDPHHGAPQSPCYSGCPA